jgi:maleylacetate reductase
MNSFTYDSLSNRVVFGVGARRSVLEEVQRLKAARVLLIADAHDHQRSDEIAEYLGDSCVAIFTDVVQHVPLLQATRVRELASEVGADVTVTFGGGSATGFGKVVALSHHLPQICIPTTYAGSEQTPIWGMTSGNDKQTGRDVAALPEVVLYDPELTLALPVAIAGPSGMNALAHSIEGLYSPGANPVSSVVAFESIRVLVKHLPQLIERPGDIAERSSLLYGAYLAGTVLAVTGTSLHHKICHVLGGLYGLDHGQMNAVMLPYALQFNAPAIPEIYERLSELLGGDASQVVYDLVTKLGAPQDLTSIGFPDGGVDAAAPMIVKAAQGNVRALDDEQAGALLRACVLGQRPS